MQSLERAHSRKTADPEVDGPRPLPVEGDGEKIHRIAQNLVLNALKYTDRGSVKVSWGEEGSAKWWFSVRDTGPGILAGPGAPILEGLKQATDSTREANDQSVAAGGTSAPILEEPASGPSRPTHQTPGEGIGLSMVKRLCDLLDASLEVASTSDVGTTFRVVLPRRYEGKVA